MENNKYYTPTIEEFHVGFECEKKNKTDSLRNHMNVAVQNLLSGEENKPVDVWNKIIYDGFNLEFLDKEWIQNSYRVKYLDKEDIEECGWKLNNTKDWWELGNLFPKESYKEGDHYLGNWKYRISLNSSKSNWYHIDTRNPMNSGQLQIFRGVIKNKSELKRLMKQLGINE